MGATDFEQAKERLDAWFVENVRPVKADVSSVSLASILGDYHKNHGAHTANPDNSQIGCNIWLDFFGAASVADVVTAQRQAAFQTWMTEQGHSKAYQQRIVSVGKAALNRAWKIGELATQPYIPNVKGITQGQPLGRPMTASEVGKLLRASQADHFTMFCLVVLATACRPDAALDLQHDQIDRDAGLIALNPTGRAQTKKHRPVVKLPGFLRDAVKADATGYVVNFRGSQVASIKTAWRRSRERAGLDKSVNPYSLRHTLARYLRSEGVPMDQVSQQLGHRVEGVSATTATYAPYSPEYQHEALAAIERFYSLARK